MYNFIKWTVNENGQPRPFADTIYDCTIESNLPEKIIFDICTKIIFKCSKTTNDNREWWESTYTFTKEGDGVYNYHVVSPYLD